MASVNTKVVDTTQSSNVTNTFSFAANKVIYFFGTTGMVGFGDLAAATSVKVVSGDDTNTYSFTYISFYDTGIVHAGKFTTDTAINSITYVANTKIFFDTGGNVLQGKNFYFIAQLCRKTAIPFTSDQHLFSTVMGW